MSEEQVQALATVTQAITPSDFQKAHKDLLLFVKNQLKETSTGTNGDYGVIPYTKGNKKTLLKPGAEKLAKLFGLSISYEKVSEVEDFDKGFVFYKYKCILTHFATGRFVGEAIRQSNSKERSYNGESVFESANKVESKAQKRALVAAVVQATNASDIFDADVSEFDDTPPMKKVTQEEDSYRVGLLARLHAVATERGFKHEQITNTAKREYKIEKSLSECSNNQLEEICEKLILNWNVVGTGNKPERMSVLDYPENVKKEIADKATDDSNKAQQNIIDSAVKEEVQKQDETISKVLEEGTQQAEEGEIVEEKPVESFCRTCNAKLPPDTYFCTELDETKDCKEKYFATKPQNKLDQFIASKGKSL